MILDWLVMLFGGRPMRKLPENAFFDTKANKNVHFWVDRQGRVWLAASAWSWYRVPARVSFWVEWVDLFAELEGLPAGGEYLDLPLIALSAMPWAGIAYQGDAKELVEIVEKFGRPVEKFEHHNGTSGRLYEFNDNRYFLEDKFKTISVADREKNKETWWVRKERLKK